MNSSVFRVFTRRKVVLNRRFGTHHRSHIQESNSSVWPLKLGQIGSPETSGLNYLKQSNNQKTEELTLYIYPIVSVEGYSCTWSHRVRHTHTYTYKFVWTPLDEWSTSRRGLYLQQYTALTRDKHPGHQPDSNPRSQQWSGCKSTP